MIEIQIDHREKQSGLPELLAENGCIVSITNLDIGDYLINNEITVERKTAQDFVASIIDGRLFKQVGGIKRKSQRPLVLIEGNPFSIASEISSESIRGALLSVQVIWYVPILHSKGIDHSKDILLTLGHQSIRYHNMLNMRHGYRPKRLKARQLYVLQGFSGIGPVLAAQLLAHYGTLRNVFQSSQEPMSEVKGIGKKRAGRICRLLDAEFNLGDNPQR
ncbi:hypothetical protein D3OALGA1CA_622 [Olavius algarvensis associated proteobacterium Delta 3]|nr:hypothetical protein D3OALGA1CA_622 [Olavius algarvensis associated proteobacterium Delta 3]CAB5114441.1 hypothetical protein D3OALGB2SA_2592 [Olavius algarvensis associated proteobacterium Delta 3]